MKPVRYYSLDVFRGATVALMILVNNPGSWAHIFSPLRHSEWNGCTPTDLVFPFFLFAVGNALSFVIPRFREKNHPAEFWQKVMKRSILIFLIGLLLYWWPFFGWEHNQLVFKAWTVDADHGIRILGVLQRIAIAYFFASLLAYYFSDKKILIISFLILIIYWLLVKFGGGADPYSMQDFLGRKIDVAILGSAHMYHENGMPFDPEGLLSTLPCIPQVLFGYLAGNFIRNHGNISWLGKKAEEKTTSSMLAGFLVLATLLLTLSYLWQLDFPYNKAMWTSSYVLLTTGLAMLTLGVLIWFIEVLKIRNAVFKFCDVFGKNPLFIYVLSGWIPLTLTLLRIPLNTSVQPPVYVNPLGWFYEKICNKISPSPELNSFIYAFVFLIFCWWIAYLLDKKKIYIKV